MTTKRCTVQDPKGWACNHEPFDGYEMCLCHLRYGHRTYCAGQPVPTLLPLVTPCCGARILSGATLISGLDGYYCTGVDCDNEWLRSGEPVTTFTPTQTGETK